MPRVRILVQLTEPEGCGILQQKRRGGRVGMRKGVLGVENICVTRHYDWKIRRENGFNTEFLRAV